MKTIAITSGKGGVGKTNLSANLGIALSLLGKKVVLFDADIGLANLDLVLGTKPRWTLQHVLIGEQSLIHALTPGPAGIRFVAGGSGIEALVKVSGPESEAFLAQLAALSNETDFLIFDTGAGIDDNVMTFLQAADEVFLVTTPDPASITDAYATAKALDRLRSGAKISLLMNMVDSPQQAQLILGRLNTIASNYLGRTFGYAGSVRMDLKAVQFIRQRKPFVLGDGGLAASQDVFNVARGMVGLQVESQPSGVVDRLRGLFGLGRSRAA